MKKIYFAFPLLTLLWCGVADAQESDSSLDSLRQVVADLSTRMSETEAAENNRAIWKDRAKYFNLGYVNQTLANELDASFELKSDFGGSLSWGKTYYLHKKPLFKMLKFGLDWSWIDLNYAKYTLSQYDEYENSDEFGVHQAEVGMQFGPSLTLNPVHHLKVSAYFRVTPSYSLMYLDENLYHHYATFCNFGAAVAWKVLSLGVEWRWGKAKYDGISISDIDDLIDTDVDYDNANVDTSIDWDSIKTDAQKFKTKSVRFYLSFRF